MTAEGAVLAVFRRRTLVTGAALLLSSVTGAGVPLVGDVALGLAVTAAAVVAAALAPIAVCIVVIVMTGSVFGTDAFPQLVQRNSLGLYPYEVLLVILILVTAISVAVGWRRLGGAAAVALAGSGLIAMGVLVGVARGVAAYDALLVGRNYFQYALLPVLLVQIVTIRRLRTVTWGVVAAGCITALFMIAQFVLGPEEKLFFGSTRMETIFNGYVRSHPSGVPMMMLAAWVCVPLALRASRGGRALLVAALVVLLSGVALNFSRGHIIGMALAALVYVLHESSGYGRALKLTALLGFASILALMLLQDPSALATIPVLGVVARFADVFRSDFFYLDSTATRLHELDLALQSVVAHPIVGIGLGSTFGLYLPVWRPEGTFIALATYTHNGPVGIAVFFGIPALFGLGVFVLWAVARALSPRSAPDDFQRAVQLGAGYAVIAFLGSSLFHPILSQWGSISAVATAVALAALPRLPAVGSAGRSIRAQLPKST